MNTKLNNVYPVIATLLLMLLLAACAGSSTANPAADSRQISVLGQTLEVPEGVDLALMRSLAAELERAVIARDGKAASDVTGETGGTATTSAFVSSAATDPFIRPPTREQLMAGSASLRRVYKVEA